MFDMQGSIVRSSNKVVVEESDLIILSVKPYQIESVLNEVRDVIDVKRHLIVSVAAGITIEDLENVTIINIYCVYIYIYIYIYIGQQSIPYSDSKKHKKCM